MSVAGLCGVFIPDWVGAGKWQSRQEVVCPYGYTTSPHNPATDVLHSPPSEDGTDSKFRNVGN